MTDKPPLTRKSVSIQDQLKALDSTLDAKDPLFHLQSESDLYFESYRPSESKMDEELQALQRSDSTFVRPPSTHGVAEALAYSEFIRIITEQIFPDAFLNEDSGGVSEALKELNCPQYTDGFIVKGVRLSCDLSSEKQKWMSELITILYDSKIIGRASATRGFEKLIQNAEDMKLDVPDAYEKIFNFIRCAMDDGVVDASIGLRLPEQFLQNLLSSGTNVRSKEGGRLDGRQLGELEHQLQTLRSFKSAVETFLVDDFMVSESQEDLQQILMDLRHPEFKHEVVRRMLKLSMGLTDVERQLVSTTLSDRFGAGDSNFCLDDIVVGFVRVLGEIEDIKIDVPSAPALLAKFMICAVVDEILPPTVILDCMRLGVGGEEGVGVTQTVKMWVLQERKGVLHVDQFRKIWQSAHPDQPETKEFKQKIREVILQHFDDCDLDTTCQQLDELEMSPDQAVVFIRKVLELSMERESRERQLALDLLQALLRKGDLHPQTVRNGFEDAWKCLPDFTIDVPVAPCYLMQLTAAAKEQLILAADFPTAHINSE